jgi:L-lactate dehydrogenase complex protein LldE
MVRQGYPKLAQDEEQEPSRERLAARTWELGEWLAAWGPFPWTPQFEGALVLHQSCKARRLGILPQVRKILAQAPGLKVLEVPPYFSCCGFGGLFKFQHPHLARDIGSAYLEAVAATGAAGMVSPDFSCLMHLREIAQQEGLKLAFFHPAEVLL